MSRLTQRAKERGWTDPYSWAFPVVSTSLLLGFFVWRDPSDFEGGAQGWAEIFVVWVLGVVITWVLFTVFMPKKTREK